MQVRMELTGATGKNLAAFELMIKASIPGATYGHVDGNSATAAAKTSTCYVQPLGDYKCVQAGLNTGVYIDGLVITYSVMIPKTAPVGPATLFVTGVLGSSLDGNAMTIGASDLNFGLADPISKCDLNGDALINMSDYQMMINQVVGSAPCSTDLDSDGKCTVIDLQRIAKAALGGTCDETAKATKK
jgi:hypothetical protein